MLGARASRMGKALLGEAHQKRLKDGAFSDEDVRRICLWLDLNSMALGSSSIDPSDQAKQRAGGVVWPKIDFDIDNRQRIERPGDQNPRGSDGRRRGAVNWYTVTWPSHFT